MVSLRVWILLVAPLLCTGAVGAPAKAPRPATAGTFGAREQLRECLDLGDALQARARTAETAAAATNARITANNDEGVRLADMKKTLDRSDKAAIAAFNELATAHNQHVRQVDDDMSGAEVAASVLAADKATMDRKCGALTWRPADVDAVNRERGRSAAAAAAASAP